MKRREAREIAFAILFEKTFKDESIDEIIKNATEDREIKIDDYVYNTCVNIELNQKELDDTISKYLSNWKLNRLSRTALSALRLGFYEILYADDIPTKVSINECVELAKKFEGEESGAFVNGVIGAFVREIEKEEKEIKAEEQKEQNN